MVFIAYQRNEDSLRSAVLFTYLRHGADDSLQGIR